MLSDEVVCLTAQVDKQLEAAGGSLASVDDVRHVRGQDEGGSVSAGEESHGERVESQWERNPSPTVLSPAPPTS